MPTSLKTSQETPGSAPDGTELVRAVQAGGNVKLTLAQIASRSTSSKSAAYTTVVSDNSTIINVTAGVAQLTITLVSASTAGDGSVQMVRKVDDGSQSVTGAANNGSGLIRITVGSTTGMVTNQIKTINLVTGTAEANGTWPVTVVDGTHLDLQGSAFVNTYVSGGTISGGRVVVNDGTVDLAWLSSINDVAAFRSDGTNWKAIGWQITPLHEYYRAIGAVTWTKAPQAARVRVNRVGAGTSGGGGSSRAVGGIRTGGAGGAAGIANTDEILASRLGPTETITNVAGGAAAAGGASGGTNNGTAGTVPANGTFGSWFLAIAGVGVVPNDTAYGAPGGGSNAAATAPSSALIRSTWGLSGSAIASSISLNLTQVLGATVGAGCGGGSATAANAALTPSLGGLGSVSSVTPTSSGIAGTAGNPGGSGGDVTDFTNQVGGGGGGGGFFATATAGTNGGRGGNPGGGGGGGAAADNTVAGGNSGKGGDSAFYIIQFFA